MGTCTTCSGAGQIPSGQYDPCYSCGGSGHGSYTNEPCMACNGSGHSGSQRYDTCWNCHGAGSTPDPKPIVPAKTTQPVKPAKTTTKNTNNSPKSAKKQTTTTKPNNLSQSISQIAIVLAIVVLIAASDTLEGGEFIFAGIGAFFAAYVALYILYYVAVAAIELLKIALKIAAVGVVILIIIGIFNESKAETIFPASLPTQQLLQY